MLTRLRVSSLADFQSVSQYVKPQEPLSVIQLSHNCPGTGALGISCSGVPVSPSTTRRFPTRLFTTTRGLSARTYASKLSPFRSVHGLLGRSVAHSPSNHNTAGS